MSAANPTPQVRVIRLTPAELALAARLGANPLAPAVAGLLGEVASDVVALHESSGSDDIGSEEAVLESLLARGLVHRDVADGWSAVGDLASVLECLRSPAVSAMVAAEVDGLELTVLLGAGRHLAALSRDSDGLLVRLLSMDLLVAVIAMLTRLPSACSAVEGERPQVVAELDRSELDAELLAVPPGFEAALEGRFDGSPRLRSVAMALRWPGGSVGRSGVSWVVDDRERTFEIRSDGSSLQVATSDPDRLLARISEVSGG